ncbi:ABC transporter permease subunit [Paenibacillus sp. HB172176]|uniref:ABC transporter permease n=1 Tax=Paenibacillus sp. HB172176 TaxID=2493690 RepID=UPI001F10305A|nr:ABC transporter permease subunit [Paenibacillus sp. HB172176]
MLHRLKRDKILLLMLAPGLIHLILFKYLPMFGIIIAFKHYSVFTGIWESPWAGLHYFQQFFNMPAAYELIRNTLLLGLYNIVWGFPAPIILAILLNEIRVNGFKRIIQTLTYLPHFVSVVVLMGMVTMFLSPVDGLINVILQWIGVKPIAFMQEASWFRTVFVTSGIWQEIGWGSIIYLAALTAISPSLYEAAEIDGASRLRRMIHVTLPGIMPAIIILFILRIGNLMEMSGGMFEKVFLLQNPATLEVSDVLTTYVYRIGLVSGNFSYGASIDMFTGVVGLLLIVGTNYFSKKVGEGSLW